MQMDEVNDYCDEMDRVYARRSRIMAKVQQIADEEGNDSVLLPVSVAAPLP